MTEFVVEYRDLSPQTFDDYQFALDLVRAGTGGAFALKFEDGRRWTRREILSDRNLPDRGVQYVDRYTVVDSKGNVYENEDLRVCGYTSPWAHRQWKPTRQFAIQHVFRPGDRVYLEMDLFRWEYGADPSSRPVVTKSGHVVARGWELTRNEWKEVEVDPGGEDNS